MYIQISIHNICFKVKRIMNKLSYAFHLNTHFISFEISIAGKLTFMYIGKLRCTDLV